MLDFLQKKYADYFLKPFLKRHLKKTLIYNYNGLILKIYPSVFHPKYFFSTGVLAGFLNGLLLKNKNFCEVGCGSGLISLLAYKKEANVVCFDLNETAVKGVKENFEANFKNQKLFNIYHSDMFLSIPKQVFDVIFINPPYFFKKTSDKSSIAWNCGENGEFFEKLFEQLYTYTTKNTGIYIALADNCDLQRIIEIAQKYKITFNKMLEKKIKWEKNYIFKLELSANFNRK